MQLALPAFYCYPTDLLHIGVCPLDYADRIRNPILLGKGFRLGYCQRIERTEELH
jgi:hypothetical protein